MVKPCLTIQANNLSLCVRGATLLKNISFDCCVGEWTLISGPSGAGKSTLLRLLNGLCCPTDGSVETLGSLHPGRSRKEARNVWRQCGTLLQEVALFDTKTVRQNVELPLHDNKVDRKVSRERTEEWLDYLGLSDKIDEFPCNLSGGQSQRVALARAFVNNPKILFLDEPISALDKESADIVLKALKKFAEQGSTIIMSSHRTAEVLEYCHQVIALENGQITNIDRVNAVT